MKLMNVKHMKLMNVKCRKITNVKCRKIMTGINQNCAKSMIAK